MNENESPRKERRLLDSYEKHTRAFVVRVWVEPSDSESVTWRGVIEAVAGPAAGGERLGDLPPRRVFARFDEMIGFMAGHLELMGIVVESFSYDAGRGMGPES